MCHINIGIYIYAYVIHVCECIFIHRYTNILYICIFLLKKRQSPQQSAARRAESRALQSHRCVFKEYFVNVCFLRTEGEEFLRNAKGRRIARSEEGDRPSELP